MQNRCRTETLLLTSDACLRAREQTAESICSLTYLVNKGQLDKQVYSHSEGDIKRAGGVGGVAQRES